VIFCARPAVPTTTLRAEIESLLSSFDDDAPPFLEDVLPLICYPLSRVQSREDESGRIESSANAAMAVWGSSIWPSVPTTSTGNE